MRGVLISLVAVLCSCSYFTESDKLPTSKQGVQDAGVHVESLSKSAQEMGLATIGGIPVLPVTDTGFATVSLNHKKALLELSLIFRDIDNLLYLAGGPEHLRIKELFEQIMLNDQGVPGPIKRKVLAYARQFWLYRGNVLPTQSADDDEQYIKPLFIPGELAAAAQAAIERGAKIELEQVPGAPLSANKVEELFALLKLVRPVIFQKQKDVSQVDGGLVETSGAVQTKCKVGSKSRYCLLKESILKRLSDIEDASKKSGPEAEALAEVLEHFVVNLDSESEYPGALLGYIDPPKAALLDAAADNVGRFDKKIRALGGLKSATSGLSVQLVKPFVALSGVGAFGPMMAKGRVDTIYKTPLVETRKDNQQLLLLNVAAGFDAVYLETILELFSADLKTKNKRLKWRPYNLFAFQVLKGLVGNGPDGTHTKAAGWLKNRLGATAPVVGHLRSDLAALYLAFDADVKKIGLIPGDECAETLFDDYVSGVFEMAAWRYGQAADQEPQMVAQRVLLGKLIEQKAVSLIEKDDGMLVPRINDYVSAQQVVKDLLIEMRRIRYVGDRKTAVQLIDTYGHLENSLRQKLAEQWNANKLPAKLCLSFPILKPTRNDDGAIVDISLKGFETFEQRQLATVP